MEKLIWPQGGEDKTTDKKVIVSRGPLMGESIAYRIKRGSPKTWSSESRREKKNSSRYNWTNKSNNIKNRHLYSS